MKFISSILFIVGVTNFSFPALAAKNSQNCEKVRAALDVGSGTAKALVAKVDLCQKKVLEVLMDEKTPIAFNQAFEAAGSKDIPTEFVESAIEKLTPMVSKIKSFKPQSIKGAATSVFRKALNGAEVAKKISRTLKIDLKVASQAEEARLGMVSAMVALGIESTDQLMVWDIGGGSMQMVALNQGTVEIYEGSLASVGFKNMVIEAMQGKDLNKVTSPNPLGQQKLNILKLAESYARLHLPNFFKAKARQMRVVGVGGVLAMSVQNQVANKSNSFTRESLESTYLKNADLKDEEIQSEYRESDITNLALVFGFMKALGIEQVETAKVSLAQALLF